MTETVETPETIEVVNTGRSPLTLPCGTTVPARAAADVPVASLQESRDNPVVRYWLEERVLRVGEGLSVLAPPATDPRLACDCAAVRSQAEAAVRDELQRVYVERDAANDDVERAREATWAAQVEVVALRSKVDVSQAEAARLSEALAAESKARADAEELAKLASDELEAAKAAAKGKAGK